VALARLAQDGWKTAAALLRPRATNDPLVTRLQAAGGQIHFPQGAPEAADLEALVGEFGVLLDGVLGTGMRLPLKPEIAGPLDAVRRRLAEMDAPPVVVAVDCPSGIDCDRGQAATECIPADLTVTMAAIKRGLLAFPAFNLAGEIELVGIGLPQEGETLAAWRAVQAFTVDMEWVRRVLPPRRLDAHKGTFGTCLVVAGSLNYTGAALLAGRAAYRSGAGLVTLAIPAGLHAALAGQFPEATWLPLPEYNGCIAAGGSSPVLDALQRATALLFGPGFGLADETEQFVDNMLEGFAAVDYRRPVVVDADGLKLLARLPNWSTRLPAQAVLTPHPGEMSVLTGLTKEEIQSDRAEIARRYSREWGHVVVLKGAFTVVASPQGEIAVIPVATPALARAGTGDVLAGLIAGLLAQGMAPFQAAAAGAWIHAMAGLQAVDEVGNPASVLAGDVLSASISVFNELLA